MHKNPQIQSHPQIPEGYKVYQTLVGTWRWSKGVFGAPSWTDGENLDDRNAAIEDAIRDAALPTVSTSGISSTF